MAISEVFPTDKSVRTFHLSFAKIKKEVKRVFFKSLKNTESATAEKNKKQNKDGLQQKKVKKAHQLPSQPAKNRKLEPLCMGSAKLKNRTLEKHCLVR